MKAEYQRNRDPNDQQILACDIDFALQMQNVSDNVEAREHIGVGKNIRSLPNQGQVLQHEGNTDRGDQRNKPRSTQQWPIGDPIHSQVEEASDEHGEDEDQWQEDQKFP